MRKALLLLGLLGAVQAFADSGAGEKKAWLCATCHKPGMANALAPLLDGQPAPYLAKAIMDYKTGRRSDSTLTMKANAASLTASDIRDIADYFASRRPPSGVYSTDPAKVTAGKSRVAELKCASCHGETFAGSGAIPRLAGQTPGYLVRQIEAFAEGRRTHPPATTPFDKIGDPQSIAQYFTASE